MEAAVKALEDKIERCVCVCVCVCVCLSVYIYLLLILHTSPSPLSHKLTPFLSHLRLSKTKPGGLNGFSEEFKILDGEDKK